MINYHERLFKTVSTEGDGDVGDDTIFRYEQRGATLIGTYSGGDVDYGAIIGHVKSDGSLHFLYHHRTKDGALKSGLCDSSPEILETGKIRLHERWVWTSGLGAGQAGRSVIEEV